MVNIEEMQERITFLEKEDAAATNLINSLQNDLLKSERETDKLLKENIKLKEQNDLQRRELKGYHCQERFPGQCHCAFKCLENAFCTRAEEKINKYRSALEEIREECKCYGRQTGSNREFDRDYGGELHINIIEQINEVLNESK